MLIAVVIVFSVLAAFFNALSTVLQRYEAGQVEAGELFRRNFIKKLSKNPKWLAAFGIQIIAFVFQAAALQKGAMIVVEPLLTIDLVFMMLLLHFYKHSPVGKTEWSAIVLICSGLAGMLISANPHPGQQPYALPHLILVAAVIAGIMAGGIYTVRRTKARNYRAAIAGIATGFSFALVATFTKIVTRQLSHGLVAVFSGWQLWALLIVGVASVVMTQSTYGSGPIVISQPAMELVEPIISVVLGIYLFGDMVSLNTLNLAFEFLMGLLAAIGIVMLSHSKRLQIQAT